MPNPQRNTRFERAYTLPTHVEELLYGESSPLTREGRNRIARNEMPTTLEAICPHCSQSFILNTNRISKVGIYNFDNNSNIRGFYVDCESCCRNVIVYNDGTRWLFKTPDDMTCYIFENVQWCNKDRNEQADLILNYHCEKTKKPLFFNVNRHRLGGRLTVENQNRIGQLYNYDSNMYDTPFTNIKILSKEGYRKLLRCNHCGTDEFEMPKSEFAIYYDDHDIKSYACKECQKRVNNQFFGYKFRMLKGGTNKFNPLDKLVGIELETIGGKDIKFFEMPKSLQGNIKSVHDGSLYNSNLFGEEDDIASPVNRPDYVQDTDREQRWAGREFVTVPKAKDNLFQLVDTMCDFLKKKELTVNKSCGFHVHFDMKKENYQTVRKTFLVFSLFEDRLFDMLPPARRKSRYCLPLKKNYKQFFDRPAINEQQKFERYWFDSDNNAYIDSEKRGKYSQTRYVSINYHSLFFHGTLENRQHSGTINATKIKNWILLNHILIDFAKTTEMKRLLKLKGDLGTFIHIIQSYEKKYPVLAQHKLIDYVKERTSRFAQDKGEPLKILTDLSPNSVEELYSKEFLNNMMDKT